MNKFTKEMAQIFPGFGSNLPRKWLKFTKEMAQIYQGNVSGSPGNVSWGPGYMPGISVNAELSLRTTRHTTVKVVKIICLLHQVCFPDIQGNSSPFLLMFPGRFFWFKGNSSSPTAQGSENN